LWGKIVEVKGRKLITEITLFANGEITARSRVFAVQMPESFIK
jgi:hypothetical protein